LQGKKSLSETPKIESEVPDLQYIRSSNYLDNNFDHFPINNSGSIKLIDTIDIK